VGLAADVKVRAEVVENQRLLFWALDCLRKARGWVGWLAKIRMGWRDALPVVVAEVANFDLIRAAVLLIPNL
jgi:hypothetical protein